MDHFAEDYLVRARSRIDLNVARRLKQIRNQAGLTVNGLAARSGVDEGQLSRLENGRATLTLDAARKLCRLYRVSLDELVDFDFTKEG